MNFEYLMYKISDRINTLADQTHESVISKSKAVETYFQQQLQLEQVLTEIDTCQKDCRDLEDIFVKLEQLYVFVDDFKKRLDIIESEYALV